MSKEFSPEFRVPRWFHPDEQATAQRLQPEYLAETNELLITATAGDRLVWLENSFGYDLVYVFADEKGTQNCRAIIRIVTSQKNPEFLRKQKVVRITSKTEGLLKDADDKIGGNGTVRIKPLDTDQAKWLVGTWIELLQPEWAQGVNTSRQRSMTVDADGEPLPGLDYTSA